MEPVPGGYAVALRDRGAPVRAGSQCTNLDANTVRCSGGEPYGTLIDTRDGDDKVSAGGKVLLGEGNDLATNGGTVDGGAGADHLVGGSGSDWLTGGSGRDRINGGRGADVLFSADGTRDVVRCGRGRDRVRADRRDRLYGCERVRRVRVKR